MKKLILLLLICTIINAAFSQKKEKFNYYNKRIHIGIKGGANLIKLDGKGWESGMKYGFHTGAFVQLKLTGRFSLQGEVIFSQLIADTARDLSEVFDYIRFSENRAQIKLNYLDIPIMLNFGIDEIRAIKLQAGIQYGLLLNPTETVLQNGKNAFKSGYFSLLGGFLWQLGPVNFGGRYLIGLDNINNVSNKNQWKSQIGQIYIGVTI
jgi:hypothetical protein